MFIVLLDRIVFIPGPELDYEQVTCHQGTQSLVCRRPSSQTGGGTSVWSQLGGVAAGRSLQVGNRSLQKLTCWSLERNFSEESNNLHNLQLSSSCSSEKLLVSSRIKEIYQFINIFSVLAFYIKEMKKRLYCALQM